VLALRGEEATGGGWLGEFGWILVPLSMGAVMFALVSSGVAFARPMLANGPLMFVGRTSYSVYLYHLPLLLLWNAFAPKDLGWLSFPLYFAILLALAWASYRFIELRYISRGRALARGAADQQGGSDRQRLQQRHAPEDVRVAAGVHEQAEDDRGDGEARVDA